MWQEFPEVLKELKPKVHAKLCEYLPDPDSTWVPEHWYAVRDYPDRQGKYGRPALVLITCEMLGGNVDEALLTAAAMQTSENWILGHDDIEDKSNWRRHLPTLHRSFGLNVALNAGDTLHMVMWKMLRDNFEVLEGTTARRVFDLMYRHLTTTTEGQYYEESWIKYGKVDMTEEDYYRLVDTKTGGYTFILPMQLGPAVAGVDDATLRGLKEVGIPFGRSFQIRDDVMNLTVSRKKQGKERGGDILEGKRTLVLVHLLGALEKKREFSKRNAVVGIYRQPREAKTQEDRDFVLGLMEEYGSIEYAQSQAERYGIEAMKLA